MVRACVVIQRTCQDHPAGHCTRREKERQTEEEMGRQYLRLDRPDLRQLAASCRGQRPMEEDHPGVISGASTTPFPGLGDRIRSAIAFERKQLKISSFAPLLVTLQLLCRSSWNYVYYSLWESNSIKFKPDLTVTSREKSCSNESSLQRERSRLC